MISLIPGDEVVSMSVWLPITKAYRYEMKPTKNQEVKMIQILNTCRHLYNDSLSERKEGYENGGWNIQYDDQQNYLPEMRNKNDETGKYLQEVYEQILQDVARRVDKAYKNFYRRVKNGEKPGFPRFKGYGRYSSFTFPQYGYGCNIIDKREKKDENGDIIRLSKIGDIKFIKHREIGDVGILYRIKTVTVKKDSVGKFFVSFAVETFTKIEIPIDIYKKLDKELIEMDDLIYNLLESRNKNKIYEKIKNVANGILSKIAELSPIQYTDVEELNQKCIGIDMGLSNLATMSNGKKIDAQEYLRESEKKLAKHQKRLSRKKRYEKEIEIIDKKDSKKESKKQGKKIEIKIKKKIKENSKNREKERIKVAKIHKKIVNQRKNFNHEVSRTLVNNFDLIAFEELNIQGMVQNHRLAKSISDASWYQLQMMVSYKAEENAHKCAAGKIVEFVDPKNTSQECYRCHNIERLELKDMIFKCSKCGLEIDRDLNASINIRNRSVEYQNRLRILSTVATTGRACLRCPDRESMIQEALSDKGEGSIENTSIQAPPFRAG